MTSKTFHFDPQDTVVIADFDGTLIKKVVNGKRVPSLISVLVDEKYLGKEGVRESKAMVQKYYPIELDSTIPPVEKARCMQEWWEESYRILKKYKVTVSMIEEICSSPQIQLRDGLVEFLNFLCRESTPLIIFSASGIGYDSIKYLLRKNHLLTDNIQVCSNDVVFTREGYFSHVKPPVIHSANKNGSTLINNGFIAQKPKQTNCLVIGDTLDDVHMANGIEFKKVIKVAFADKNDTKFQETFDFALPLEGTFFDLLAEFES